MRHEVTADECEVRNTLEWIEREPRALDGGERDDDDTIIGERHRTEVRLNPGDFDGAAGRLCIQLLHVAVRHDHELPAHVVIVRFLDSGTHCFHQHRHCAEFVERKKAGPRRATLHGERRLQLEPRFVLRTRGRWHVEM